MKKFYLVILSAGALASAARADLFDDIQSWAGSGANEAALEIDWNNGAANDALIWGYRFNGTATGEQMLDAIVAADPRLYAELSTPGEWGSYGTFVYGLGFHPSGDQNFQLSPALSFDNQLAYTDYPGVDYTRTAVTTGDFWQEGFANTENADDGYWNYFNSTDTRLSTDSTDWDYASAGMTTRLLDNGDVDGLVFAFNDGHGDATPAAPMAVSPVPEPATWAVLILGGVTLVGLRKYRHAPKIS